MSIISRNETGSIMIDTSMFRIYVLRIVLLYAVFVNEGSIFFFF